MTLFTMSLSLWKLSIPHFLTLWKYRWDQGYFKEKYFDNNLVTFEFDTFVTFSYLFLCDRNRNTEKPGENHLRIFSLLKLVLVNQNKFVVIALLRILLLSLTAPLPFSWFVFNEGSKQECTVWSWLRSFDKGMF